MLLPKRQGKEWISGRNCWQLHGRTHRPLEVMAQDRTGHWRVERCPEATSHESSQVWLQVWRFFFCNGSWEHNSRVFSTGCFFNCYNTLASSILTHYIPALESLCQASTILTRSTSARVCAFGYWHSNWGNKWKRILRISAAEERSKEKNNICWKHIARQRTCCVLKVCENHSSFL